MDPGNSATALFTVDTALQRAWHALASSSPTPRLDAEILLRHVCKFERSDLITRHQRPLTDEQQNTLQRLITRRQHGEPMAYLTGAREFWSMEFVVSPATLIPRPETEVLVEQALARIPATAEWTIADLGTGCGTVALALAKERPRCRLLATDHSPAALNIARTNARAFGLTHVEFREGDWFGPLAGEIMDMIVSNPPYVSIDDPHLHQGDVRFEPSSALVSGQDGLAAICHLAENAMPFLKPNGWLMLEHGSNQARAIEALLRRHAYRDIVFHPDLAGHARVVTCHR